MLTFEHVTQRFGRVRALTDLSLHIPEGMIFGLLGPNGAGKTTLIRLLMGLIEPTEGTITLFERFRPRQRQVRHLLGYMPQKLAIYPALSCRENVHFYGHLYDMDPGDLEERCEELLALVDLQDRADDPVGTLSGGMVRRAMLATALIHRPRLLVLDEPTAGVDPSLRLRFWDWFARLTDEGTSILVTTHHISEASRCREVLFLREGRLLERGSPETLMSRYHADNLETAFITATEEKVGAGGQTP